MPRIHLHVVVDDLAAGIRFYSLLLGNRPTLEKDDYAEWELESPPVNLDITTRGRIPGLAHVGIQFESDAELGDLRSRLEAAGYNGEAQQNTGCCYERSNKYWVLDPAYTSWELFHTLQPLDRFTDSKDSGFGCCAPLAPGGGCNTGD
ncbi:MAG TPA: VOC family protein [Gammaproteobacteria bacterium]|nr:VOC family protein [Gammaproteobacteria bacterium]